MKFKSTGFTLLEVLVALAVAAIGLAAVIKVAGGNAYNAQYLQEKTFAQWVALNRLAELQLEGQLPAKESKEGSEELMGRRWFWLQRAEDIKSIGTIEITQLRKVEVSVYPTEDQDGSPLAVIEMLMGPQ